jgi:hypothetical protein
LMGEARPGGWKLVGPSGDVDGDWCLEPESHHDAGAVRYPGLLLRARVSPSLFRAPSGGDEIVVDHGGG